MNLVLCFRTQRCKYWQISYVSNHNISKTFSLLRWFSIASLVALLPLQVGAAGSQISPPSPGLA